MNVTSPPKFEFGKLTMTAGVHEWMDGSSKLINGVLDNLVNHGTGDWGLVDDEDKRTNDDALQNGGRLLSAYDVEGKTIWVITEADRSATTVLFPEEY